ncbi:MAG: glycosyltransferase [Desulfobacca sp.]|nr:glycosyltransferase [Desulfobacca sp.]
MIKPLTISIAMTTYNGERFLQEQLDSFTNQSRLPDELVVCDDGSQDSTMKILQAFAERAPFKVRLYQNPENLGVSKNFEKAMSLCQGDIIVLSDQDDVWRFPKLAIIEQAFIKYPNVGLVLHDAVITSENLYPLEDSMWKHYELLYLPEYLAAGHFTWFFKKYWGINGAFMALSKSLLEMLLPIPPLWCHDKWISFAGSTLLGVVPIPLQLTLYRNHPNQTSKFKLLGLIGNFNTARTTTRICYQERALMWKEALYRFLADAKFSKHKDIIPMIETKIEHYLERYNMPDSVFGRVAYILANKRIKRYHEYSRGWLSIAKDIVNYT